MSNSITNWVKKNIITRFMMKNGCPHQDKCFEVLETYLDGEATREETESFNKQMDSCWKCYQEYKLDRVLKQMVKERDHHKEVPEDLIKSIQVKIDKLS